MGDRGETESVRRRVLVVDDDNGIRTMLASVLEKNGMEVRQASCVTEAQALLSRNDFHAMVLDWMMPGEDGASFLRRIRSAGDTIPVIMLSARTDEIDRILGLESGADDYVPKPFSAREVAARISAIWRRLDTPPPAAPVQGLSLPLGAGTLDCEKRTFTTPDGSETKLSDAEFSIAKAFARNPGVTLSRDRIMTLCGSGERDAFDRSVDVRVARLRKAICDDSDDPCIRTVRGVGYSHSPSRQGK